MVKPDCVYQSIGADLQTRCQSPEVISTKPISLASCSACLYRVPPASNFFSATANLFIKTGPHRINVKSKPCGGCGKSTPAKVSATSPLQMADNDNWTVAITTAPRQDCTLTQCIDSVRRAGWEPTIFAEPGSTATDAKTITNSQQLGVWHNWLKCAKWCLDNTDSDLILTVQDDSLFHPDSRTFTESVLWPDSTTGFVSLYTPRHYSLLKDKSRRKPGVNRIRTKSLWGACALVWSRTVLQQVVEHRIAARWLGAPPSKRRYRESVMSRRKANPHQIANSDTAIGKIMNAMRLNMYFVDPSPVSHIAIHSTIGHGGNAGKRNCLRCADHAKPLADQVFPQRQLVEA